MSHGAKILAALRTQMAQLGRKPSDVECVAVIDAYLVEQGIRLVKIRKNTPKLHARDAVFDVLAKCDGVTDTKQLTRHGAQKIAGAKKQILEVLKANNADMTVDEVVAEIEKRWARYCRKYPEKPMQTAMALVGHWGNFADLDAVDRARTEKQNRNIYVEPLGNWRGIMTALLRLEPGVLDNRNWLDMAPDYRLATLLDIETMRRRSA